MSRQLINLHMTIDQEEYEYTGRFLGFIKDDEFNALVQNTDKVAAKIESKATQSIMDVASAFSDMAGYRLVMTVKKIFNQSVPGKILLITDGLDVIDKVIPSSDDKPGKVGFQTLKQDIITVEETE